MEKTNTYSLIVSIVIFTMSGFTVHLLLKPELSVWGSLGYAVLFGIVAGVGFYLLDRRRQA